MKDDDARQLLGGSRDIVPMRQVLAPLGASNWPTGDGATVSVNHLPGNLCIAKITGTDGRTADSADVAVIVDSSMQPMCMTTQTLVPFSSDGKGARGWYFTTKDDFDKKASGFTILKRQVGDPTKDPLCVVVFGGKAVVDGIGTTGSINLGRAPVRNATEARQFVDKVLAY